MRKIITISSIIIILGLIGGGIYVYTRPETTATTNNSAVNEKAATTETGFNKQQYSLTDPTSIWIIANKHYALPIDYEPTLVVPKVKLRLASTEQQMHISKTAEPAIEEMFGAAKSEGVSLVFGSGYRSAALQKQFYNDYVRQDGQAAADTYSARPGHSEHQTGLALDVTSSDGQCHLEICWENTVEGKWIAANSYKYGFIIRYPNGKDSITGYQYEPWHIRYVGKDLAAEVHKTGQTLEEFFDLGAAPSYD